MGSAAFIMADYTGIDYSDIAIAAVIPALLYYLCIYTQVHFRSLKMGLRSIREEDIPRVLPTLKDGPVHRSPGGAHRGVVERIYALPWWPFSAP